MVKTQTTVWAAVQPMPVPIIPRRGMKIRLKGRFRLITTRAGFQNGSPNMKTLLKIFVATVAMVKELLIILTGAFEDGKNSDILTL